MWIRYVLRETSRRRRQSAAISAGLAVAVAVVIVVSALSAGLAAAQDRALGSLHGVGTDLTVTQPAAAGAAQGPKFTFPSASNSAGGQTTLAQSQLVVARGLAATPAADVAAIAGLRGVSAAEGLLLLDNYDFAGMLPNAAGQPPTDGATTGDGGTGGSAFTIDSFRVAGVDSAHPGRVFGSLHTSKGRALSAADMGTKVALVDARYATENQLDVGMPVNIGGVDIPIVGLVTAANGQPSIANAYLPLDVAQSLSGQPGKITSVFVKTDSAASVSAVSAEVRAALPHANVATQADLALTMTGTLAAASGVSSSFGGWVSLIALIAATLIAALLTIVGVSRRSREFGTLKALGWRGRSIVAQVGGESLLQGAVGAAAGIVLAAAGIAVIDAVAPQLTATLDGNGASTQIPLVLEMSSSSIVLAAAFAIVAAIVAAIAGSMRVSSLRPSESLRSDQ